MAAKADLARAHRTGFCRALACLAVSLALAGCGGATATPTGVASPNPSTSARAGESALPPASGSALPTEAPAESGSPVGSVYIRLWFVNPSLGPDNFFFTAIVISNGKLYYKPDPAAASPAPLYVAPLAAAISPAGLGTIVGRAGQEGLLGATHEFTCPHAPDAPKMAGTGTTYLKIVVNGVSHDLTGTCQYEEDPSQASASPAPGTYGAFVDFADHLRNISGWLGSDLEAPAAWTPASLAVTAATPDSAWWSPDVNPGDQATWVAGTFAAFGNSANPGDLRCGVLSGNALASQLPSIEQAQAGTLFVDSTGAQRVLALRVVMPDEPTAAFCT
jgi:hypothetical protein